MHCTHMNPRPGGAWSHQEVVKASTQLAHVVRARMEQKRLSVRGLARLAGISPPLSIRHRGNRLQPTQNALRVPDNGVVETPMAWPKEGTS